MTEVARILCGSHLYGTAVEGSDRDYKVVYIPPAQDILLGRSSEFPAAETGDVEYLTLQTYMRLLCEGQTSALDMLFAGDDSHSFPPTVTWKAIQQAAPDKWVSKRCKAFVRYCRDQAHKYVIKKERTKDVYRRRFVSASTSTPRRARNMRASP